MKASITLNGSKRYIFAALSIIFWLVVWEVSSRIVDAASISGTRFIFPTVGDTFAALLENIATSSFWISIAMSLCRILLGFLIGVFAGIALALFSLFPAVITLIRPIVTLTRSIPVASFIMIIWLVIRNGEPFIPSLIAALIVFPVVWQSAYDAATSPPKELSELADIYKFSPRKRITHLILPSMLKGTLPSIITASGLAWKSGVAAEIITYTAHSIGRSIAEAKGAIEGDELFAWTAVVVFLSLAVEAIIKFCSKKAASVWEY